MIKQQRTYQIYNYKNQWWKENDKKIKYITTKISGGEKIIKPLRPNNVVERG